MEKAAGVKLMDSVIGAAATIVGAFIAVGGAIWTFRREQRAVHEHEQSARQARIAGVCKLLQAENEHNLGILVTFWDKVTKQPPLEGSDDGMQFEKRLRLAQTPLLSWGHLMWTSQVPFASEALDSTVIQQLYTLHARLDQFTALRAEVREGFDSDKARHLVEQHRRDPRQLESGLAAQTDTPEFAFATKIRAFIRSTSTQMQQCDGIYEDVRQLTAGLSQELSKHMS